MSMFIFNYWISGCGQYYAPNLKIRQLPLVNPVIVYID